MDIKDLVIKHAKQLGVTTLEAVGKAILEVVKDLQAKTDEAK